MNINEDDEPKKKRNYLRHKGYKWDKNFKVWCKEANTTMITLDLVINLSLSDLFELIELYEGGDE